LGGFVNYFDVSRFTIAANQTHEIAAFAASGDYFRAVSYATQTLAERMPFHSSHFTRYVNASDKASATVALRAWADGAKRHKLDGPTMRFLQALSNVEDFSAESQELRAVWMLHPHAVSMHYSSAEFLWNAMVSQRLLNHGLRVVVGDLVRVDAQGHPISAGNEFVPSYLASMNPSAEHSVRLVVSEDDARRFDISDVVLPTPYPHALKGKHQQQYPTVRGVSRCDFVRFAASHRLEYLMDENAERAEADDWQQHRRVANNTYRSVVAKPEQLQFRSIRDPNSFTSLKSDVFMMQERLPLHMVSELDERRVREPSIYNISEAFAERMATLRDNNRLIGDQSVVVTGFLPRGADVPVMLREAFDVRHVTFSDLLEPSWS
jgi:tRNA(Glu) U13 pseudouridine synthase TruD